MDNEIKAPKKTYRMRISLILIIIGILTLVAGIIYACNTDMSKYNRTKDVNKTFESTSISKIHIKYGAGNLNISKSNDDKIHVSGKILGNIVVGTDNDTFNIGYNHNIDYFGFHPAINYTNIGLNISLPDKIYDSFVLDMGAGQTDLSDVSCKTAKIDLGAGQSDFKNFTATDSMTTDCGAGQVNFKNCNFNNADVDCGVGEFNYSGKLSGNTKVDCGVGACNLTIDGKESDYKFTGKNKQNQGSNSGTNKLDIDNGVGETTITFIG